MTIVLRRRLSAGLVLALLMVSGPVYAQTVRHATHHAHHNSATHATVQCSFLCAAGQVLDTAPDFIPAELGPTTIIVSQTAVIPADAAPRLPSSRGPPLSTF
jgi:hypothetical protein